MNLFTERNGRIFAGVVGAMDAATGLLLVVAPATVMRLLGTSLPGESDVPAQWIGTFVLGVGLSYFVIVVDRAGAAKGVWIVTMLIRTLVAVFVFASVGLARLEPAWLTVGLTDGAIAAVQAICLWKGGATS